MDNNNESTETNATGFNLDDEFEVSEFIKVHGTLKGIALAHKLGIKGKGIKKRANDLSGYAWNKQTAINERRKGNIQTAIQYEDICDRIYQDMSRLDRW